MTTLHEGARVSDGEREGYVAQIVAQTRRGLEGAAVVDVCVRFDDGATEWCNPNELWPLVDEWRDGRP